MTDLAASDVTISVTTRDVIGKHRMSFATVSFGDGAKTYPTGGVPITAITQFGMLKSIDMINIEQPHGSGYEIRYNKTTNKFRIYISGAVTGHTHTLTPSGTNSAPAFTGSSLTGHTHTENAAESYTKDATTGSTSGGTPAGTVAAPTFTGSQGTTSSSGSVSAAALSELGNVAVAATSFVVQVWGH